MLVGFGYLRHHALLVVAGVAAVMGGKTVLASVGPALAGYAGRVALLAGLAVAQIGEVSFVLAREGRTAGPPGTDRNQGFPCRARVPTPLDPFPLAAGPAAGGHLGRAGGLA